MQRRKVQEPFFRRALAPFLVGPSTVHGTPERTHFLIDHVSDPYVLCDKDRITFLAKLVKNIPKEDRQAVQRMVGTSSEAIQRKHLLFGIMSHFPHGSGCYLR
jgi:hypothetical protein